MEQARPKRRIPPTLGEMRRFNDMSTRIHPLSLVPLFIEIRSLGKTLSHATAFVVESAGKSHLVSNAHVFTGRHADTGKCLDPNLAIPDEVLVRAAGLLDLA